MSDTATAAESVPAPKAPTAPESTPAPAAAAAPKNPAAARLMSLDAYRGFTMILMASGGLHIAQVARNSFPDSAVWKFLAFQTDHVAWRGCALWDLIQPSFMFMVGVSLPYSVASRREKGDTMGSHFGHAVLRSALLVLLSVFLVSQWSKQTNLIFTNVLAQIGLGYPFLFLLAWTRPRTQLIAACAILAGYWALFAFSPLPPADFDYSTVGLPRNWDYLAGFEAHWQRSANPAHRFDAWFLNLFPRDSAWKFSSGGYATLNFVPSLATMIFGLLAGEILRGERSQMQKVKALIGAGLLGLALGTVLDWAGVCPSVKRIWTPSWALFSSGWTFLALAAFYLVIDVKGYKAWTLPLLVAGMNSIAMYVMEQASSSYIRSALDIHVHSAAKRYFSESFYGLLVPYGPILQSAGVLLVMWLVCLWMYRRKIFLRI